ncbi:RNA polymerase sigma factor SigZ [Tenacibaculum salmonis]|uniref:RNA polymerase sigma factor SigZ n=1 Tax=Tenacibaculum sp. P3-BQ1 TaxID=3232310 RepID=UPI0034DFA796
MQTEIVKVWNDMNNRLSNFVNSKVHNSELTKDIVQDVFLKIFSKNDTLKNKDKLVSWIYQITRNEIVNHFRKNKFTSELDEIEAIETLDQSLTSEISECMHPMINNLPDKYREALILSDIKGIPQKEIAKQLNISYSGAKSRVQRGREMLKATYLKCCDISTDVYGDVLDYNQKGCVDDCDDSCD